MYVGTKFKAPLIGLWADIQRKLSRLKLMYFKQNKSFVIKLSLNNRFDIGTVFCPCAVILAVGLWPRANKISSDK